MDILIVRVTIVLYRVDFHTFLLLVKVLYELPKISKEITKEGFHARIIMNPEYKTHKMLELKNIDARFLDIDSEATTTIFPRKNVYRDAIPGDEIIFLGCA